MIGGPIRAAALPALAGRARPKLHPREMWLQAARFMAAAGATILMAVIGEYGAALGTLVVAIATALPRNRRARPVLSQLPMLGAIAADVGTPAALAAALVGPRLLGLHAPGLALVFAVVGVAVIVIVAARLATNRLRVIRRFAVVGRDADGLHVPEEHGPAGPSAYRVEPVSGHATGCAVTAGNGAGERPENPVGARPSDPTAAGAASGLNAIDHAKLRDLEFGTVAFEDIDVERFAELMHRGARAQYRAGKRALDLAFAIALLPVAVPLVGLLALVIWMTDGKSPFFSQARVGEGGVPFTMFKLRTMRVHDNDGTSWCTASDERVTTVGRLLRRTHLDEVPQLFNVLRGDMSMVGPRPEQPHIASILAAELPYYAWRESLRPGLTGWAQVRCGYAGSPEGSAIKLRNDLFYLKHRSFGLDIAILLETVWTLIADRQYDPAHAPAARELGAPLVYTHNDFELNPLPAAA